MANEKCHEPRSMGKDGKEGGEAHRPLCASVQLNKFEQVPIMQHALLPPPLVSLHRQQAVRTLLQRMQPFSPSSHSSPKSAVR
jgi:hypothetical protein